MSLPVTLDDARRSRLISLATEGMAPNSKRSYTKALTSFLDWQRGRELSKATVKEWLETLTGSAATKNARLAAVRKFATEAADNGLMDHQTAEAIRRIKGTPKRGERTGNWLTLAQAELLINAPDPQTVKGVRDRALLGVLIGCGLRREEVSRLTWADVQQREGRWVIVDLHGKGGRIRTVPMPAWTKALVDDWQFRKRIGEGRRQCAVNPTWGLLQCAWATCGCDSDLDGPNMFCPVHKGGNQAGANTWLAPLEPHAIYLTVLHYCRKAGLGDVAPHSLRRTFAKLAHKGGAKLDQIQLTLGHSSVRTTEVYLNVDQELTDAPCDKFVLKIDH